MFSIRKRRVREARHPQEHHIWKTRRTYIAHTHTHLSAAVEAGVDALQRQRTRAPGRGIRKVCNDVSVQVCSMSHRTPHNPLFHDASCMCVSVTALRPHQSPDLQVCMCVASLGPDLRDYHWGHYHCHVTNIDAGGDERELVIAIDRGAVGVERLELSEEGEHLGESRDLDLERVCGIPHTRIFSSVWDTTHSNFFLCGLIRSISTVDKDSPTSEYGRYLIDRRFHPKIGIHTKKKIGRYRPSMCPHTKKNRSTVDIDRRSRHGRKKIVNIDLTHPYFITNRCKWLTRTLTSCHGDQFQALLTKQHTRKKETNNAKV